MSLIDRMTDFKAADTHTTTERERAAAGIRPSGEQLFKDMTEAEQDELLGKQVADAVRSGEVSIERLVVDVPMETEPDFISQASGRELGIDD